MLEQTIKIIKEAGKIIEHIKQQNKLVIETKKDNSIVTNADYESEKFIVNEIYKQFGKDQVILSEEAIATGNIPTINSLQPYWLIDPIDATSSYINNDKDYCINITYLVNHIPTLGLIYAPYSQTVWYAIKNQGSFKQEHNNSAERIKVREIPNHPTAVTSKKGHQLTTDIIEKYNITQELVVASAIKFCYIAEGKADYYFRKRNKACDWDIASGDIIVTEAGGEVILDNDYQYGTYPFLAPNLIAKGKSK